MLLPVRVDFYLLTHKELNIRWLFACRLIEKAYLRGHCVFVFCNTKQEAELVDQLLWTFKDESFIPHHLQHEESNSQVSIQIGYEAEKPIDSSDILLNLADEIPIFFSHFKRVMEIVINDETLKQLSRIRYRNYKDQQCELHTHSINF